MENKKTEELEEVAGQFMNGVCGDDSEDFGDEIYIEKVAEQWLAATCSARIAPPTIYKTII